jgi:hypothetical protein
MKIICPECGKIHLILENQIPKRKSAAKCKKCGAGMIIDPFLANHDPAEIMRDAEATDQQGVVSHNPGGAPAISAGDQPRKEPLTVLEESESPDNIVVATSEATVDILAIFPDLKQLSPEKFAYGEIFAVTNNHGLKKGDNRLILRLVAAIHDILTTKILRNDEMVLRLARGIIYRPFEIFYANGLLTMRSNYFAIVCTNQRLLLVNIDGRTRHPTRYIYQVPYGKIAKVNRSVFLSSIIIKSRTGRRWNLTTVKRKLAKSIKNFILEKVRAEPAESGEVVSQWQLCPACYTPLPEKLKSCPHCSAAFKTSAEAMLRSFILPGLGSIYLANLTLGLWEMTGYLFTWLLAVGLMVVNVPGGIISAIAPVLIYHLATGLLARKNTGKGYLLDQSGASEAVKPSIPDQSCS